MDAKDESLFIREGVNERLSEKGFTLSSNVTSNVDVGGRLPVDLNLSDRNKDNEK